MIPQNPVADRRCPPTVDQILRSRKITAELAVAFSLSGHRTPNQQEHGGWIYQNRRGGLEFIRAGSERATAGSITVFTEPGAFDWVLIARPIARSPSYALAAANLLDDRSSQHTQQTQLGIKRSLIFQPPTGSSWIQLEQTLDCNPQQHPIPQVEMATSAAIISRA